MPGYDLHTHSNRSDGTLPPAEVMVLAAQRDLAGVALTDHDTFDGLEEAATAASELGLDFVPGVEFSAEYDGASLHILGYWVDPDDAAIEAELLRLTATRFRRGEMIVEKLHELGFDISIERVRELAGGDAIARPHIAEAMVEAGIVADEKEAFDRYIADDGLAYVPKHALPPMDALRLIGDAGGVCVLAHPGMWRGNDTVPDELIEEMADRGDGGPGGPASRPRRRDAREVRGDRGTPRSRRDGGVRLPRRALRRSGWARNVRTPRRSRS